MSITIDGEPIRSYWQDSYDFRVTGFFKKRYYVYHTRWHAAIEVIENGLMYSIRKRDFETNDPKKIFMIYDRLGFKKVTEMK